MHTRAPAGMACGEPATSTTRPRTPTTRPSHRVGRSAPRGPSCRWGWSHLAYNEVFTFNFNLTFTRVINHCVTVLGNKGLACPDGGGESSESVAADS